ncbi:MAG: TlyA family RNA methyltransferase [Nitrospirae bacterium]|jgi:23S rRNA (cytidine1920-2'-O)/16S rRNA (cytidine1409-2'-O)-methyltransferase|nr:TlyA family RNA methyltransferase [Nitrospirota bacterium]
MKRLDQLVLQKGWASSREKASELIVSGRIRVKGIVRIKPSVQANFDDVTLLPSDSEVSYVSRGGTKLAGALSYFGLDVSGKMIVDLGASTGGFTQALLEVGARKVHAVDVGSSQLDSRLRSDPRVISKEGVNVRWPGEWFPAEPAGGVVADLSFISLSKITKTVFGLLSEGGFFLPLFKPQFEAGPHLVGKGGIVRDRSLHRVLLSRYVREMVSLGAKIRGVIPSPITGRKGNQEYFILFEMGGQDGRREVQ